MGKFIDMTGLRFGRLEVLKREEDHIQPNGMRVVMWKCKCDCGNEIIVNGISLRRNKTMSCGCLHKESAQTQGSKNKKYNSYDLSGEYGIGYTKKNKKFYFDKEDYDLIKNYCWFIKNGYIMTNDPETRKTIRFHRLVMNVSDQFQIDHINHKRYDNRKNNLRIVTNSQNSMNKGLQSNNTSGVTGVSFYNNMWNAEIRYNQKKYYLGSFDNKEDAIKARKEAEEKYFGEYSYANSMKKDEDTYAKNN